MKMQAFVLLMLVLTVSAKRRIREGNPMPPPEGACDMVQPFDQDFIYTYQYVAYTEHRDSVSGRGNDIRITCTATITVPRRCAGKLRVNGCRVEEGTMSALGRIEYRQLPSTEAFERDMGVNEMAFHFNGGQITRIFVDKQERTNVTNFKRGILSSLQAYNPELPKTFEIGDVFEVSQMNVYGQGVVEHKILGKVGAFPSVVEVTRDTSKIALPWERRQWNFIRMRNNKLNPILSAFKNYVTVNNEEMWSKARQNCRYTLARGRQLTQARCEETFPLNLVKPEFLGNLFESNPVHTTIRQEIDRVSTRRMTAADRSDWDVSRFDEDSIMFEEEWEETNMVYTSGFDAPATFLYLVREPVNDKSPALVSKLSRWMAIAGSEDIEKVWAKCENECSRDEKEAGRLLWVELLNSCIANDWCQVPYCSTENVTSCQTALESFVTSTTEGGEDVKKASMASLEAIDRPSENVVDAALRVCRAEERTTPFCVRTLAIVTRNFLASCENDCENVKPVAGAKAFLVRQLKKDCGTNNDEIAEVMKTAAEWIGRLGPHGRYAETTVLKCATNPDAPPTVAMKALIAYGNVTEEIIPDAALASLVGMFQNKEEKLELRITCFHVLMKKSLAVAELEKILTTVMDDSEHYILTEHCRDDIRTQLLLRGTMFCQFHPIVASRCVDIILRNRYDIGISSEDLSKRPVEKSYEMTRELEIPYFNTKTKCTIRIDSVYEKEGAFVPVMSKLVVTALIEGRNVTILEMALDIANMKPMLDRIFGHNVFYTEMLGKLLKTPLYKLHGYAKEYPLMNALKIEGRYANIMNVFDIRSPLYVRVLGYEISLDALMGMDSIRRVTLGNFWEIIDALEAGFEHEAFVAGQPFLMQHAAPTCIGAPMISTVEFSYIMKNKLNLKANLRKMLYQSNEKAIVNIAPELHVTGIITRTVLPQFSESCGTELKVKFGHGSAVQCALDTTLDGISATCTPKPGRTQLFYLNGRRSLTGPDAVESAASVCVDYRMRDLCVLRFCHEPFSTTGFAYEMYVENEDDVEYSAAISLISKAEEETKALMKEFKVECTAKNRATPSANRVLWSSIVSFVPSRKEVSCNVACEWFKWRAIGNFEMPKHETLTGLTLGIKASGIKSLEYRYFVDFKVVPENAKKYVIEGECKVGTTTDGFAGYGVNGLLLEAPEGGNTTRKADFTFFNIERKSEPILVSSLLSKKVPEGPEGMTGFETYYKLEGSLLPLHKKYEVEMLTYDNEIRYDKIMRMSGHFENDESDPHFFVHRVKGTWKHPVSEAYDAEVYCVCNLFNYEYTATCDNKDDMVVRAKWSFPERKISYNEVVTSNNPHLYNVNAFNRPVASYIGFNYTSAVLPTGDRDRSLYLGYRLWSPEIRDYYYETGTAHYITHSDCSYCHTLTVKHPKVELTSISRYNGKISHEEKWLKLHYSLLNYIYLRPSLSYYLINNVRKEYIEVGYKGRWEKPEAGKDRFELEAALLRNTANCLIDVATNGKTWTSNCNADVPAIPLNLALKFDYDSEGETKPTLAMDCEAKYAGAGAKVVGEIRSRQNKDVSCMFTVSYGTVGGYENEDTINLSFVDVQSRYDITGYYKNTYAPTGESYEYKYVGTSQRKTGGKRDLDLKAMCPSDPTKVCSRIGIEKGENWIEYERLVNEDEYDRMVVNYKNGKYSLSTSMINEILWDVRALTINLELGNNLYAIGIESPICNITCKYNINTGFEANSVFSSYWLQYNIMAMANSEKAKYEIDWDGRDSRGYKIVSTANLIYNIFNWDKEFDGKITLGASPKVFKGALKIPDFDIAVAYTKEREDLQSPVYKYYCDMNVVPYKIIVNELRFPVYEREVAVRGTTLESEYRNNNLYGFNIKDISVKLSSACEGQSPMVISGQCAFNSEKGLIKIADADRYFVVDVLIDPANPHTHHIEFILTMANAKVETLWDMKNVNNKVTITEKCEISTMCWKTKQLKPVITFTMMHTLGMTPATGNFPEVNTHTVFNHDLPIAFIPKTNQVALTTTINGGTTMLHYIVEFGNFRPIDMTTTLIGCYRRMEPMPGFSLCMPNEIMVNTTINCQVFRSMSTCVMDDVTTIKRVGNEWAFSINNDVTNAMLSSKPVRSHLSTRVEIAPCEEPATWCVPKRVHIKDLEFLIPVAHGKWMNSFIPMKFTGIHISQSEIVLSREILSGSSINSMTSTMRNSETGEEITINFSTTLAANRLSSDLHIIAGEWKLEHLIAAGYVPETWAWNYHHKLDCASMNTETTIAASSPFAITRCDMTMAMPNGFIRSFTLTKANNKIDAELNLAIGEFTGKSTHICTWEPSTMEWETVNTVKCPWMTLDSKINGRRMWIESYTMDLVTESILRELNIEYAEGNGACTCKIGTVDLEIRKKGPEVSCDFKCGSLPWFNQTFVLSVVEEGQYYTWNTEHVTEYYTCSSKFSTERYMIYGKQLDCRMKNTAASYKVEYITEYGRNLCRITLKDKDNTKISCLTTPMYNEDSEAYLECQKVEGTKTSSFARLPVKMMDFPFMGNYIIKDKALFLARYLEVLYKTINYDEKKLGEEYQKYISCNDESICYDLAKRVKTYHYAYEKELKRIAGAKMYYFTNPEITEYIMYQIATYIPGSSLLPEWNSLYDYSIAANAKKILSGSDYKFLHWNIPGIMDITLGAKFDDKNDIVFKSQISSSLIPLINCAHTVEFENVNGEKIVKISSDFHGWNYAGVFRLDGGELRPVAEGHCFGTCKKGIVWKYNWAMSADGRHNFTLLMLKGKDVQIACDLLTMPSDWSNTEIACYEGLRRETLVGKISIPELSSMNYGDYTDMDSILREILHIESAENRNKIYSSMDYLMKEANNYAQDYYNFGKTWRMAYNSIQYAVASFVHETAKYTGVQEVYDILYRCYERALRLEPNFGLAYQELKEYFNRVYLNQDIYDSLINFLTPVIDSLNYALEGFVKFSYEFTNGALVVTSSVKSIRFPILNCETTVRVERRSYANVIFNITTTNKFITMFTDARLNGPVVVVDRVRFGLPEVEKEFLELRMLENPIKEKPYIIEMFFADSEGQAYGCRGGRSSFETPMIHMHCYLTEGVELPPNPSSAKLVGYFDVELDNLPHASRSGVNGLWNTLVTLWRMISACSEDSTEVDRILTEVFHVHDATIRQKLTKTIGATCRKWVEDFTGGIPGYNSGRSKYQYNDVSGIVELSRTYKTYSYDTLVSTVRQGVVGDRPLVALDLGLIADVMSFAYTYCAPAVHLAYSAVEYLEPAGRFELMRCSSCRTEEERPDSFRFRNMMTCARLPVLDFDHIIEVTTEGMINTSMSNNLAWGWIEWELTGLMIMPRKGKCNLANDRVNGIEIVFWPEDTTEEPPTMSLILNVGDKTICDARIESLLRTNLKCRSYKAAVRGPVVATCNMSPTKTWMLVEDLIYEAMGGKAVQPTKVGVALEKTCVFNNPEFKSDISNVLVKDIEFIAQYCRGLIRDTLKAYADLLSVTYSTIWKAIVDTYNWWYDMLPTFRNISIRKYFRSTKEAIDIFISWCEGLTVTTYEGIRLLYNSGYLINEFIFYFPTYLPSIAGYEESIMKYYHSYYNYMNIWGSNIFAGDSCAFGMIHGSNFEQAITMNNHFYYLPQEIRDCKYLLAGELKSSALTVLLYRNNLVISMPKKSIAISPDMRVFEGRTAARDLTEVTLPFYDNDVFCVRESDIIICGSPSASVVVHGENNRRTKFFVKIAETLCPSTRGMMGIGANTSMVPEMLLMNDSVAGSMKDFINAYSTEKSCTIKTAVPEPQVTHELCDAMFEREQWMSSCPNRRMSFLRACQTGATTPADACVYARSLSTFCNIEGRPTEVPEKCTLCGGNPTKTTLINRVQVTVIMSMSRKTNRATLEDITEAVRTMANERGFIYEISFVTFGGRDELYSPAFIARNGKVATPSTETWAIPKVSFNGPAPLYQSIVNTLWLSYMGSERTTDGVGKIFLFVAPEDMDYDVLSASTIATWMRNDLVNFYLLTPSNCERMGGKSRATYGVRPLFTNARSSICMRTPSQVASAIAYPHLNNRVTCTCRIANPYTGQTTTECAPAA